MPTYISPIFQAAARPGRETRHRVVVAGGGMVGLTAALDLARRGIAVVVLNAAATVGAGSRAICMAKRSLEIFDRLGVGARMLDKGVTWNRGEVLFRDRTGVPFRSAGGGGSSLPGLHQPAAGTMWKNTWLTPAVPAALWSCAGNIG